MDRMDRQQIESHRSGECLKPEDYENPYDEEIDKETVGDDKARANARRSNANSALLIKSLWGLGEF